MREREEEDKMADLDPGIEAVGKERRGVETEGNGEGRLDPLPCLMVLVLDEFYRVQESEGGTVKERERGDLMGIPHSGNESVC